MAGLLLVLGCAMTACSDSGGEEAKSPAFELPSDPAKYAPVPGFTRMDIPADNPMTLPKAELGRQLFFDKRLSGDGSRSCYSCHLNDKGLTDGIPTAIGAFEKKLTRNSPTLWNIGYHSLFYWDGRKDSLETQAMAAWKGGNMGAKDTAPVLAKVNSVGEYTKQFQDVFGGAANDDTVVKALACYMRTIVSRDTPWDRYKAGDENAVSEAAKRGFAVFEKANCQECHVGVLFTDMQFHNVGIGMKSKTPDVGFYKVTKNESHTGAFKTPTLRDVSDSAPYFHDGSVPTLRMAVELMAMGGMPNKYLETRDKFKVNKLTSAEIDDLIEFLKALDEPSTLLEPTVPD